MRQSVGTIADFENVTWPANANATLTLSLLVITSSVGIPANLLVLYISFYSKLVVGNYKYFLANLALTDLFICFGTIYQLLFHLYHLLYDVPLNISRCYYMTFPTYMFGFFMGASLPLASFNRYFVICHDKEEWFTRKKIALLCALAYFPILFPIIDFLFAYEVVAYCDVCAYNYFTPFNPEWIIVLLSVYVYPSLIIYNMKVYKKLSTHMSKTVILLGVKQQNERSILKALVIQAAVPPICMLPLLVMFATVQATGFDRTNTVVVRFGENGILTVLDLVFISYNLNQTLDALVTLCIAKPYWMSTKQIFFDVKRKLFGGDENAVQSIIVSGTPGAGK